MWKRSCWANKAVCLILAALLSLATGCAKVPEEEPSGAAAETEVIFTDALGREVSVPKDPARVASLVGSYAEVWVLAGGTLCAAAADAWEDFGLELGDAANLGTIKSPSFETLLAADPDFVIASASTAADVDLLDAMENAGLTVAYFDVDSFDDYLGMLGICTDITGRKDLYEQNGLAVQAQIEAAREALPSFPEGQETVLLLRISSGSVRAKGSEGTVLGEMLAACGCVNIADRDGTLLDNLSIESILERDPYRIFVVQMGGRDDAVQAYFSAFVEENPAWQSLAAVSEGRVYFMDRRLFHLKPNARWGEAYETLCGILGE